jgi:hypothetical protein
MAELRRREGTSAVTLRTQHSGLDGLEISEIWRLRQLESASEPPKRIAANAVPACPRTRNHQIFLSPLASEAYPISPTRYTAAIK